MSTIQMIVDLCTCCYRPVEDCKVAQKLISRGVPIEWITEERLYPEEVAPDVDRVAVYTKRAN